MDPIADIEQRVIAMFTHTEAAITLHGLGVATGYEIAEDVKASQCAEESCLSTTEGPI